MLHLDNVSVQFSGKTVLDRVNLQVPVGEFLVVIGENGAGKSTLFNVISGATVPSAGQVRLRTKKITRVLQDPRAGTLENMTIFENMAFAYRRAQRRSLLPCFAARRVPLFREKLSVLHMDLENRLNEKVSALSGGQRQALSLVMAILADYDLLLLDEFTAALDPQSSETLLALTNKILRAEQKTAIMITHNMDQAWKYGDRIVILKKGQLSDVPKSVHLNLP
ncbi:ABC transporter ATP-binding protein [Alphaproteobacteria bacterium]|nr:ABC transporter ATP-binding protein [Alphaproteobacteria bacterium]GHS95864.1 ABC transporter ATP-binding protein [Alphaproteobacteria bacterium]